MRRAVVAATLALACAVGVAGGAAAHARWPHPLARSAGAAAPAASQPSARATPTPTPSRSPSRTPSPTPSRNPSGSPTSSPGPPAPAFTPLALLRPPELVAHGWQVARQVDAYPSLPAAPITPCTTVPSDGLVTGFAATYTSNRTTAAEVVTRFGSTAEAERAFDALRAAVASCVDAPRPFDRRRITGFHDPELDGDSGTGGVDELRWWNTRTLGDTPDRGVIGIVRAADRVALLALGSAQSDPAVTTRVDGLLALAGRRLV